jgi:S1-C subfamily serine protease
MKAAFLILVLICVVVASAKDKNPSPPPDDKVLVLEPIKIQGSPILSFAIDITVYADPKTKKVNRIFISRVHPDTDAEKAGLQAGDEIVKLDGVAVKEFDAVVSVETPLGQILLNRHPGEPLKLEVLTRRTQQFTVRAQREWPTPRLSR